MPVQDSFIALGASMLAVWLWFVLVVLLWFILLLGSCRWLGFCLIFCAGSGCGAAARLPVLIWFVFFWTWFCVWLAWGGRLGCGVIIPVWALVELSG